MLVEIPDPDVILSVIVAFLVGVGGLFAFYKIRPMVKTGHNNDESQAERLEYYERQLIDMKIRLDALEIQGVEPKVEDPNLELKQFLEKLAKKEFEDKQIEEVVTHTNIPQKKSVSVPNTPNIEHINPIDYVLHLITNKDMTSRDIQITLKKSREHTSRLMKKLFEEGYVQRNTNSKPYTYSITQKGLSKVEQVQINPTLV